MILVNVHLIHTTRAVSSYTHGVTRFTEGFERKSNIFETNVNKLKTDTRREIEIFVNIIIGLAPNVTFTNRSKVFKFN